LHKFTRVS